jgi:hypothetical protein
MTTRTFNLQIAADISKYQKEFAKIPGFTEAKAAAAAKQLAFKMEGAQAAAAKSAERAASKSAAAHERAAARSGDAWERHTAGAGNKLGAIGGKAGDAEAAIRGMSGAIGMVSPQTEKALNVLAEMGGATEGAARGYELMGSAGAKVASKAPVIAVAIAGITAATAVVLNATQAYRMELRGLQDDLDGFQAAADLAAVGAGALGSAELDVVAMSADLQQKLALARGEITDMDVAAGEMSGTLADDLRPELMAAAAAWAENETQVRNLQAALDGTDISFRQRIEALRQLEEAEGVAPELAGNLEAVKGQLQAGNQAINDYTTGVENLRAAQKKQAEEDREARKAEAEARRRQAEAEAEAARIAAELAAARDEVAATGRAAALATMSEVERTIALYDEQLLRLDALEEKHGEGVETSAARAALEAQQILQLEELRLASVEKIDTANEKAADKEEKRRAEARAATQSTLSEASALFGAVGDLAAEAGAAATSEEAQEAARAFAKKMARLQIIAAAASGAVSVAATAPLNPIYAAVSGAALIATTIASLATVERLHGGGFGPMSAGLAPDERVSGGAMVTLGQERVVTEEGARNLGEDAIRAAERGQTARPNVVVVDAFRNYGRFSQDELRRPSPTANALRSGVTGQRSY